MKRIHAQLFQHGAPEPAHTLDTVPGRLWFAKVELPATARQVVDVACAMIDTLDGNVGALDRELKHIACRPKGCLVLQQHVGVGLIISASMLAELGDVTRLSSSRRVVRFAGIDVTVAESDGKRECSRRRRGAQWRSKTLGVAGRHRTTGRSLPISYRRAVHTTRNAATIDREASQHDHPLSRLARPDHGTLRGSTSNA